MNLSEKDCRLADDGGFSPEPPVTRQTVSFPVEFHSRFSRRYKKANSSTCKYLSAGQVKQTQ